MSMQIHGLLDASYSADLNAWRWSLEQFSKIRV